MVLEFCLHVSFYLHEKETHAFLFVGYDSDDDYGDDHDRHLNSGSRWVKGKTYARVPITTADDDLLKATRSARSAQYSTSGQSRYPGGGERNLNKNLSNQQHHQNQENEQNVPGHKLQPPKSPAAHIGGILGGLPSTSLSSSLVSVAPSSAPPSRYHPSFTHAQTEPSPLPHEGQTQSPSDQPLVTEVDGTESQVLGDSTPVVEQRKLSLSEIQNAEYHDVIMEEDEDGVLREKPMAYLRQTQEGPGTYTTFSR